MSSARILLQKHFLVLKTTFHVYTLQYTDHVATLVSSHLNGLLPSESTIRTNDGNNAPLSPAAAMTTNLRIQSSRELLQYLNKSRCS